MIFNPTFSELKVVLVRPIYERNVGATSRAMSNMGFDQLILIQPQCEITYEAQKAAATGQDGLQNRIVYSSWQEFLDNEPMSVRVAFSAKNGKVRQAFLMNDVFLDLQKNLQERAAEETPKVLHLVFGPEDWGLSNADLEHCNHCAYIPTFGPNSSLNLAQAALLGMAGYRSVFGGQQTLLEGRPAKKINSSKQVKIPDSTLHTWLSEMGFDLSNRKNNVYDVLRRVLLQNNPTEKEVNILEIVLQQSIRKLREYNKTKDIRVRLKTLSEAEDNPLD